MRRRWPVRKPLPYHNFHNVIKICRLYGTKLHLTTNGTLPRPGVHEWALPAVILEVNNNEGTLPPHVDMPE